MRHLARAALLVCVALLIWRPASVFTAVDPALVGQWSPSIAWPHVGVAAHLLNTGEVLFWEFGSTASTWDPASGQFTPHGNSFTDLLCSGHTILSDGRVITLGGWERVAGGLGRTDVSMFSPVTHAWTRAASMATRRWYPTGTMLPDGRVLVTSGNISQLNDLARVPEIYNPVANTWTSLTLATKSLPLYPFMFVLPDGRILVAGSSEVATTTQALDLTTQRWTVMDPVAVDGASAVMFTPGKILKAGTAADSGNTGAAARTAFVLDTGLPKPSWRATGAMAFARSFMNLTALPDGTVLVTGGGTDRSSFNLANAIKPAEIWSPVTGAWSTMSAMQTPRLYHSTALLLRDARVLVTGGGSDSGVADQLSAEIYSPPYLFKGARPTIASAPSSIAYGGTFQVSTPDAAAITSVSFIGAGSVTHFFNTNQRFVKLGFQPTAGGLTVTSPATSSIAPPGYYLLFLVNSAGVPSVGKFVNLPAGSASPPPGAPGGLTAVAASNTISLTWTAAVGAVNHYNVYRSTTSGFAPGAATLLAQSTATTYADQGLASGTYFYRVTAVNSGGSASAASNEASATIAAPPPVTVPTVVGQTQTAASGAIVAAGLTVGAVTTAPSAAVAAGLVASQVPGGGSLAVAGSAVALVISSGPPPVTVTVPTVVGQTQTAASGAIVAAGLTVGAVTTAPSAAVAAGLVASQVPGAGSLASGGSAVALVISSGPGPVGAVGPLVDRTVFSDGSGTLTTPAFSTATASETLVAFVAAGGSGGSQTATITGAGLAWTLVRRVNTQRGTSEIWTASTSAVLTNVTVSSTLSRSGFDQSLTVVTFSGASGVGASAGANASSGAPGVALTTTRPGALVYGVGNDTDGAIARTPAATQTIVHQSLPPAGMTFWVQALAGRVTVSGTLVQVSDTAPTTDRWNFACVEIIP